MRPVYIIAGIGLLGGSIALSLRRTQPGCRIHVYGRDGERLQRACSLGYADGWSTTLEAIPRDARGAFVCTPVDLVPEIVCRLLELTGDAAFVTDVGSTKAGIVRRVQQEAVSADRFVGSHPMAGSEKNGYRNARDDLFAQATVVLTPVEKTRADTLAAVRDLWTSFGSRVVSMTPEQHDTTVGMTSHLPHLLSFCYAAALAEGQREGGDFQRVWGNGLRDVLRLAGSDPDLWSGIMTDNRSALLRALDVMERQIRVVRDLLDRADRQGLTDYLAICRKQLEDICVQDR